MRMQSALRSIMFSAVIGATTLNAQSVTEPSQAKPCVVVMGGGGAVTGNDAVDGQWFAINSAVSRAALAKLEASGLRTIDFIVDIRNEGKRATEMARQMEQHSCQKVLQIAHELRPPSRSKPPEAFAFVATVLEVDTAKKKKRGGGKFTMAESYKKEYEYAMTREVLETISMSEVGEKLAKEILESGSLLK